MIEPDYFETDPDWAEYAQKHGYPLPSNEPGGKPPLKPLDARTWDFEGIRAGQAKVDKEWSKAHPLSDCGYETRLTKIQVRDGSYCSVKVSWPSAHRLPQIDTHSAPKRIPVLFVTHGGGWVQGTHTSEEAWLLWPLYQRFNMIVVSVEYRLAPENPFPTWIEDSWDVLQRLLSHQSLFLPTECTAGMDLHRLYLAGSSAGAGISAVVSQWCREKDFHVAGVILNVPVLCDYRDGMSTTLLLHGPKKPPSSFEQCIGTFSDSRAMMALWEMIRPCPDARPDPLASPLLGDFMDLPPHLIFVAGQDPVRDEGLAYARKLQEQSVPVTLQVYSGVPHNFAHFWELKATQRFWEDLSNGLDGLLDTHDVHQNESL